jgi:archaellum component FlaC
VSKLDEKVDRLEKEIRQVKNTLNENNEGMKRQQRENVERIEQNVNKEKLETKNQLAPITVRNSGFGKPSFRTEWQDS